MPNEVKLAGRTPDEAYERQKEDLLATRWLRYKIDKAKGIHKQAEPDFPFMITRSGPIDSAQKLQKIAQSEHEPKVHLSYETSLADDEPFDPNFENDPTKSERIVRYARIHGPVASERVRSETVGDDLIIWFDGKKRNMWKASDMKKHGTSTEGHPQTWT